MFKKARKFFVNNMDAIAMGLAVATGSDFCPYID